MSTHGHPGPLSSGAAILLVDDNPEVARAMRIAFEVAGHRLEVAAAPEEAFSRLARARYDAVLLDLNFTAGATAGSEGMACLDRIMADDPGACVIVITAHSGIRIAVAAMQAGARDFVMKPWRNSELLAKVEAAIARGRPATGEPARATAIAAEPAVLLGESAAIMRVRDLVRRLGPTAAGIAVTGPSGTGRMLVARAVHAASPFAARPPLVIDARDSGQWEALHAATGSVILRHVDRLDDLAQARLVAAWPFGARAIAIADTAQALAPALRGLVATVEIAMPTLAARGADALLLARHFLRMAADRHALPAPILMPAAERLILDHIWVDEARGLALAIERATLLASDGAIDAAALAPPPTAAPAMASNQPGASVYDLAGNEKAVIAAALRDNHHNVSQAAAALGLSRGALYRRMERHGL